MSDRKVRLAIEQMEAWLADPAWEAEAEVLATWEAEFQAAQAQAERGEGWQELVARAHAAGRQLDVRANELAEERDRIRVQLDVQDRGHRALKGYGAGTR